MCGPQSDDQPWHADLCSYQIDHEPERRNSTPSMLHAPTPVFSRRSAEQIPVSRRPLGLSPEAAFGPAARRRWVTVRRYAERPASAGHKS